jgi:hypothetical protein
MLTKNLKVKGGDGGMGQFKNLIIGQGWQNSPVATHNSS